MPIRKSAARRAAAAVQPTASVAENGAAAYLRPVTCYSSPHYFHPQATPYSICSCQPATYPAPWNVCNTAATYVVDTIVGGYYITDFEYQLQSPQTTLASGIAYEESVGPNHHTCVDDVPDEEQVRSCKRKCGENNIDIVELVNCSTNKTKRNRCVQKTIRTSNGRQLKSGKNIYRTKQGYIVEEPSDDDEPKKKANNK